MTSPKAVRHLTEDEFAERLGITVAGVRKWRKQGLGPAYIKGDGKNAFVRYRECDIEAWEKSRLVVPGAA